MTRRQPREPSPAPDLEASSEPELLHLRTLATRCDYDSHKLARTLHLSQRQLQRLFARRFACSPQAWLNQERLLRARQMLGTAGSIKEVAYSLGFRRTSQFSRDFRNLFGLTPSQACRLDAPEAAGEPAARTG